MPFTVRRATPEDVSLLAAWYASPALQGIYVGTARPDLGLCVWIIEDDGVGVGAVELFNIDHANRRAEIGVYTVDPAYLKTAVVLRTAHRVVDTAFGLGLHRLEAKVQSERKEILALAKRAGFKEEGVLRDYLWIEGRARSVTTLRMLSTEYTKRWKRHGRKQTAASDRGPVSGGVSHARTGGDGSGAVPGDSKHVPSAAGRIDPAV